MDNKRTPYFRAFLTWGLMMLFESVSGILRQLLLQPRIGDLRARQIGVAIGALIVVAVAVLASRWIAARTFGQWIGIGVFWVLLTITFEVLLGRALGFGWERITADYRPSAGGYMGFGLLIMFLAPLLTAGFRSTKLR